MIAIVAGILSVVLASIMPCVIGNNKYPLMQQMKLVYKTHKQTILASSLIVAIATYLSLKALPSINSISEWASDMSESGFGETPIFVIKSEMPSMGMGMGRSNPFRNLVNSSLLFFLAISNNVICFASK